MQKRLKLSVIISLILGIVSFCWLIFNFIAFEYIRHKMINFEEIGENLDTLGILIHIGLLVFLLFHICAILSIVFQLKFFEKAGILRAISFFVGIISFLLIFSDSAMLHDIGNEYKPGWEVPGEWTILYICHIIHGVFHILTFILNISTLLALRTQYQPESAFKDEAVFITAQYVGILCGITGLASVFVYMPLQVPLWILKRILNVFSTIIFVPYGLIAFYWLIMKRKEKIKEWYDEKQFRDITKASLITLILSMPCMAVMYLSNYIKTDAVTGVLWFPFYVFLMLLLFSGSTLYYSKKE